jgi:hypothetical protein
MPTAMLCSGKSAAVVFYFAEPVVLGVPLRVSLRTAELIG